MVNQCHISDFWKPCLACLTAWYELMSPDLWKRCVIFWPSNTKMRGELAKKWCWIKCPNYVCMYVRSYWLLKKWQTSNKEHLKCNDVGIVEQQKVKKQGWDVHIKQSSIQVIIQPPIHIFQSLMACRPGNKATTSSQEYRWQTRYVDTDSTVTASLFTLCIMLTQKR